MGELSREERHIPRQGHSSHMVQWEEKDKLSARSIWNSQEQGHYRAIDRRRDPRSEQRVTTNRRKDLLLYL